MSFRKERRVVVGRSDERRVSGGTAAVKRSLPGTRPSPLDGRLTTSTGTQSLDSLLAGHAGLALGTSLLIGESGTTDFGGSLLKYYAAEGVVQGHFIHVLGLNEGWGRELPGLTSGEGRSKGKEAEKGEQKMKIAWRYERLGEFGAARDRNAPQTTGSGGPSAPAAIFCHDFDLSKHLILPSPSTMRFVPASSSLNFDFKDSKAAVSPFTAFLTHLTTQLSNSPDTIHRVVIPNLLSPALYSPESSKPEHLLQFFHGLRALLRRYPTQLTAMVTLPLTLYPRSTGFTRWMELLSDGVLELAPFPSTAIVTKTTPAMTVQEEPPQGMLRVHRLPIFHEKGGGGGEASGFGNDLAFTLSRRKGLVIKPYSLPPVDGDLEAQKGGTEHDHGKATKGDIEF